MAKVASQMRFDETLYQKAKYIAEKEYRSVNAQIEYFISVGIKQYEKENGVILLDEDEQL